MRKTTQEHLKILLLTIKLLLISFLLLTGSSVFAQGPVLDTSDIKPPLKQENNPALNNPSGKVLKGNIAQAQYLPSEYYGTWQVTQTLLSTNAFSSFKQRAVDIWILEYVGDRVRLSNPDTGAQAYVTVKQIVNNSATFTREGSRNNLIEIETPTIAVNGNYFSGQNYYQIRYIINNKIVRVDEAVFRIEAIKIAGPSIKFGR